MSGTRSDSRMSPVVVLTAAAILLVSTACGSTVATRGAGGLAAGADQGNGANSNGLGPAGGGPSGATSGGAFAGSGTATGGGGPPAGANGSVSGGSGSTGSARTLGAGGARNGTAAGSQGQSSTSGRSIRVAGPGITDKFVNVGIPYSSQGGSADAAIGASGASPSYDTRQIFDATFAYANKLGGLGGRQLKGVYYDESLANDKSSEDQAACSHFTQDNKVFAMYGQSDILRACAEKAHAVGVDAAGSQTAQTFQTFQHLVDVASIRLDRLGVVTVNGLASQKYFTGKLGLITWDESAYRYTMTKAYLPTLASHGVKPATDPVYVSVPQQPGAISDTTAAVSAAVNKFKALGVDHVIIVDGTAGVFSGDGLTFEFEKQAQSQKYYPRYGGNANNAPGFTVNPHDEEQNGLFITDSDSLPKYDVGWHPNQARELCFKVQANAGLAPKNDNDSGIAALICDFVFSLRKALASTSTWSADAVVSAYQGFGTSFAPASVYGSKLTPGRRDGSGLVRVGVFQQSCTCLKYVNTPHDAG